MSETLATDPAEMLRTLFAPWVQDLNLVVEAMGREGARLRLPFDARLTRIGGTISGQALMALADTAMVFAVSGASGGFRPMTTVSQTTQFMRAIAEADVVAEARILRLGRTMAFGDVLLSAAGEAKPAVQVSSVYAILAEGGKA